MTTRHVYDRRGRQIRSVTVSEPRWTDEDRAEVLAWALYRRSLCPCGCGHPARETTSHEETGPQYKATRIRCRARDVLQLAQDELRDVERPEALLWQVQRTG